MNVEPHYTLGVKPFPPVRPIPPPTSGPLPALRALRRPSSAWAPQVAAARRTRAPPAAAADDSPRKTLNEGTHPIPHTQVSAACAISAPCLLCHRRSPHVVCLEIAHYLQPSIHTDPMSLSNVWGCQLSMSTSVSSLVVAHMSPDSSLPSRCAVPLRSTSRHMHLRSRCRCDLCVSFLVWHRAGLSSRLCAMPRPRTPSSSPCHPDIHLLLLPLCTQQRPIIDMVKVFNWPRVVCNVLPPYLRSKTGSLGNRHY